MKKFILFFCFTLFATGAFAQLRFDENFNYPCCSPADTIGNYGWVRNTGITNPIFVASPGLVYAGYSLSGIGNACALQNTGYDAYKDMSQRDSTGSLYVSCMVNVSAAQSLGDYFLAFLPNNSTSFYSGRIQVRSSTNAGFINFGLTRGTSNDIAQWTSQDYSLNTTYLLVMKYTFIPGGIPSPGNDEVSLFVFTSGLPAIEPTPTIGPFNFSATSSDPFNIGRIALRQGTDTRAPTLIIDGIHVARTWFSTTMNVKLAIQGLVNVNNSTMTRTDTAEIYLRNSISPYVIVDSAYTAIDPISLTGTFEFVYAQTGTYYLDVRYRHLPVFRNGITTWSASGLPFTRFNGTDYDFTNSAAKAYGSNQMLLGTIYSIFNGDVNQNGFIGSDDISPVDNDAFNFASGYINTDVDGDDFVGAGDLAIVDNNAFNFVSSITPP